MRSVREIAYACTVSATLVAAAPVCAQTSSAAGGRETIEANEGRALSEWDGRIAEMIRRGELKLREEQPSDDGVHHDEWYQQLHKGVRVEGGDVWRQTERGKTTALEGTIFTGIKVNPVPKLTREEALSAFQALTADGAGPSLQPELIVLPRPDGSYVLAYRARIFTSSGTTVYALDASTGAEVWREEEAAAPKD
jgi:outer membrane protein assembly factor BamB